MSFKREGDDPALLANLMRRRVSELLASHIPEDEALLLKNGRYACTVCHHRPIFDTLEVLALHRKSKKHLFYLSRHLRKSKELKDLKQKKQHEAYLQTGIAVLPGVMPKPKKMHHSLLKAKPYNSCCRPKLKIDVETVLKDKGGTAPKSLTDTDKKVNGEIVMEPSSNSLIRSYIKSLRKRKDFSNIVVKARKTFSAQASQPPAETSRVSSDEKCNPEQAKISAKSIPSSQNVESQQRYNYYVNLRMSGWKKEKTGEWIKDEDAEFDSDEETPTDYPS